MLSLGAISFAAPWALAVLAALPVIWWLLRLTPPLPREMAFPPIRILMRLTTPEESAARTPWWLLLLRLALAALVILGAAHPLLNAGALLPGSGPLVLVVDDGWAAAGGWSKRRDAMLAAIDRAGRAERPVALLSTAPEPGTDAPPPLRLAPAAEARKLAESLQPKPWPVDRAAARARLTEASVDPEAAVLWLADGVATPAAGPFADSLAALGTLRIIVDGSDAGVRVLEAPSFEGGMLVARAARPAAGPETVLGIRAVAADGRVIGREELTIAAGETTGTVEFELPPELLNRLESLHIEDLASAAARVLIDERWRRRPVGLLSAQGSVGDQPLLSDLYFLRRALTPFTEVRRGNVADLLSRPLAVLAMADPGRLDPADERQVMDWLRKGGVVVRFAGPRLAEATSQFADASGDDLLPVALRRGDRVIGGALSWSKPAQLAAFPRESPFFGLSIPDDVVVRRQVLAQPAVDLQDHTWAALSDGTPLATAAKRGDGWLVLIHTTANTDWSNLALSGLFVEMLSRLVELSQGVTAEGGGAPLEPKRLFDGFGRLGPVPASAVAIPAAGFDEARAGPLTPPGIYGDERQRRALNLAPAAAPLAPLAPAIEGQSVEAYAEGRERDLRPFLYLAALLLFLVDTVASLALRGLLGRGLRPAAAAAALLAVMALPATGLAADDAFARGNSLETRIAYVRTGDATTDEITERGLIGLNRILRRRTAAELGAPQPIDPGIDELAFFPLIYWPVTPDALAVDAATQVRIKRYMKNGGSILFDTRDRGEDVATMEVLRRLARALDLPPLVPVPPDHVLTRAFYLLNGFPGRWDGGSVWIERAGSRVNDGVSPVIAGGNDWAAAWAIDDTGRPLYPVVPGGERQRELAYRFGVNLVMHVLTGNYKADQVHMPAIMKRLGQ